MEITSKKQEGIAYSYTVNIPQTSVNEEYNRRLSGIAQSAKIDGFRPGKAPMNLVEGKYGGSIREEVLDNLVGEAIKMVVNDSKGRLAATPTIKPVESKEKSEDIAIGIDFEILPEIVVKDFSKIKVERKHSEVTDKDLQVAIDDILDQQKVWEDEGTKEASKKGDLLKLNFAAQVDGVSVEDEGKEDLNFAVELGSGMLSEDFEKQLVGKKGGSTVELKKTVDDKISDKDLKGKEVAFKVKVVSVHKPKKAVFDDALAQNLNFETAEEFKNHLKSELQNEYNNTARVYVKKQVLDALADMYNDLEIPQSMCDREYNMIWSNFANSKEFKDYSKEEIAKAHEEYNAIARRRVLLGLVLSKIGSDNKVEVTNDEIKAALFQHALSYGDRAKEVLEYYAKHPKELDFIGAPIFEEKVVDYIASKSNLKEVKISAEELYKITSELFDNEEEHVHDEFCNHDHDHDDDYDEEDIDAVLDEMEDIATAVDKIVEENR